MRLHRPRIYSRPRTYLPSQIEKVRQQSHTLLICQRPGHLQTGGRDSSGDFSPRAFRIVLTQQVQSRTVNKPTPLHWTPNPHRRLTVRRTQHGDCRIETHLTGRRRVKIDKRNTRPRPVARLFKIFFFPRNNIAENIRFNHMGRGQYIRRVQWYLPGLCPAGHSVSIQGGLFIEQLERFTDKLFICRQCCTFKNPDHVPA
ncbi:hypothetical protein ES703_116388 [subsurface metagenome]